MKPPLIDRRVHATYSGMEVVRYDRMGKWFLEPTIPGLRRQRIDVADAARMAAWGVENAGGTVTLGIQGGRSFDQLFQLWNPQVEEVA